MTPSKIKPAPIPDWLKQLPKTAKISSRDLCGLFGVSQATVSKAVTSGKIPKPDSVYSQGYFWDAKTIRNFLRGHYI